jgi:hypothetical protein
MTWVLIAKITDEFILGLDVLHIHDESVDLEPLVLQQGEKGGAVVALCDGRSPGGSGYPLGNGFQGCLLSWSV